MYGGGFYHVESLTNRNENRRLVLCVVFCCTSLICSEPAGLSSFLCAKSMRNDLPISSTPFSSVTALEARSGEAKST